MLNQRTLWPQEERKRLVGIPQVESDRAYEDSSDGNQSDNEGCLFNETAVIQDRLQRRSCDPIILGRANAFLSKYAQRSESVGQIKVGDFVCVKVSQADRLPFYVGKVNSVFQYHGKPPSEWEADISRDTNTKFLEVHWWQMPGDSLQKGYSERLYEAVRENTENRCVDHVQVICETSVIFSFEELVNKKMKGGKLVSGKIGKRVLGNVMELVKQSCNQGNNNYSLNTYFQFNNISNVKVKVACEVIPQARSRKRICI